MRTLHGLGFWRLVGLLLWGVVFIAVGAACGTVIVHAATLAARQAAEALFVAH